MERRGHPTLRVVIRRSPPLFTSWAQGSGAGNVRRAIAIIMALGAALAGYWCLMLLISDLRASTEVGTVTLANRWHVWMGMALVSAASARVLWGRSQRPTNLE